MRAVRNAPPEVEIVDVDEPEGDGEFTTSRCGRYLCLRSPLLDSGAVKIAGHEFAGVLDDGTAVAVEAIFGCATCAQCDRGNFNRCETARPTALGMLSSGGMSEYFRAPRQRSSRSPPAWTSRMRRWSSRHRFAWHGCHMGSVGPSTRVAVVGGGAIGILAAASAQAMGVEDVALEATSSHQFDARDVIGAVAPSGYYDVVLETGGSESSLHRAVELARPGGAVVYMGVFGDITWPHAECFMKEVALRPSLGYCAHEGRREFAEAADMLAGRPELAQTLITHRFPIEDAQEAFRVARDKSKGVFRVVIEP